MHARRFVLVVLIVLVAAMFSAVVSISAQTTTAAQALNDLGVNCANLAMNTTCLGHGQAQRLTSSGVISPAYTQPGDRASIVTTHQITTAPVNAAGDFGLNVMRAQAGNAASSKGILYLAFGGTTMTNVGGPGQAVWQNIRVAIDPTGSGSSPRIFVVQGHGTITVNGTQIVLGSTVVISFNSDGSMTIEVVEGSVTIGGVVINAGQKVTVSADGILSAVTGLSSADGSALQILLLLPTNIFEGITSIPVQVCPSGVGQPNCTTTG